MAEPIVKNGRKLVTAGRFASAIDACLYSVNIKGIRKLKVEAKGLYLSTDLTTSSPFDGFVSRL
jgi:hypothetical protein